MIDTPKAKVAAVVLSGAGHVVHNLAEFPAAILLDGATLYPLAITVVVGALLLTRPGPGAFVVAAAWALIVILGGGLSVLPLPILPFTPEQTPRHYGAHVVYALSQLPLLWVAVRGIRGGTV